MSLNRKAVILSFLSVFIVLNMAQATQRKVPYKGRVSGSRVNIRGSHTTSSDVLTQLKKGQDVTVIEERQGWSKIIMPYGISTWVYAPLIKDNLVDRDTINVRSGPAVHYSVLAKLKRGDVVKILDEVDNWIKISPPAGVGGWISSQYVTYLADMSNYDKWLEGEKEAKIEFEKIEMFRKKEMFKQLNEVDFNLIIKKYNKFIKKYSAYPESKVAKDRIADAENKKVMAQKSGDYVEHSAPVNTSLQAVSPAQSTASTTISKDKASYIGKIIKLKKPVKEASYCLKTTGLFSRKKCYLVSNDFDLSKYVGQKVTLIGLKLDDDKKPLVNVTEIAKI